MFLKNKNIIFKIRRSKVTDYAALRNKETQQALRVIVSIQYDAIFSANDIYL